MSACDDKTPLSIQIHSTMICSSQPFSLRSFLPSFPLFPFCHSFTSCNFLSPPSSHSPPFLPPPPPVRLLFLCAALTHSSNMLKRGRMRKQKGRGWKGEERKGGKVSEKARDWSAGHFLSHCCGEKDRESESAKREIKGKQTVTEMERLRNSETMKATYVKRD